MSPTNSGMLHFWASSVESGVYSQGCGWEDSPFSLILLNPSWRGEPLRRPTPGAHPELETPDQVLRAHGSMQSMLEKVSRPPVLGRMEGNGGDTLGSAEDRKLGAGAPGRPSGVVPQLLKPSCLAQAMSDERKNKCLMPSLDAF